MNPPFFYNSAGVIKNYKNFISGKRKRLDRNQDPEPYKTCTDPKHCPWPIARDGVVRWFSITQRSWSNVYIYILVRTYKRHRNSNPGQLHCTTAACTIPLSHHFYTISFLNENGIKITYKIQCLTKYFNIVLKYFVYTDGVRFYHNSYL